MIATEPLPDAFWDEAGLADRETFADHRHLVIYGQRTEDGRMAFGGRGAPYHFGSTIRPEFDRDAGVHEALRRTLVELFPALADVGDHPPLGRAARASPGTGSRRSGIDPADPAGLGRRLRGRRGVDHQPGRPHPARPDPRASHRADRAALGEPPLAARGSPSRSATSGINAGLRLAGAADRAEERAGRATWHARALGRLVGG